MPRITAVILQCGRIACSALEHSPACWRGAAAIAVAVTAVCSPARAGSEMSTAFTYQGQLKQGDSVVVGSVDLRFRLMSDDTGDTQVGPVIEIDDFLIEDGLFTVDLDFGPGVFTGKARWLEVAVRVPHDPSGMNPHTVLSPRQPIMPAPYAQYALNIPTVLDGGLLGNYSGVLSFSNPANSFSGSGAGLTNLNAGNVSAGKLSSGVLPTGGDWNLSSNLTIGDGTIFLDHSNRRVSIGSSATVPERSLHVMGEGGTLTNGIRVTHPELGHSWDLLIGGSANSFPGGFAIAREGGAVLTATNAENVGIGTTTPSTKFHVRGTGGYMGGHLALFESTAGLGADGIAIKINNPHTGVENNFITFVNGSNQVTGRIEGFQSLTDWETPPTLTMGAPSVSVPFTAGALPTANFNAGTLPSASFSPGSLPSFTWNGFEAPDWSAGSLPSLTFSPGSLPSLAFNPGQLPSLGTPSINWPVPSASQLKDLACWAYEGGFAEFITLDPVSIAAAGIKFEAALFCKNDGTVYGSKGADYAEWLPKRDPTEKFQFGQIVGIHAGKVSLITDGADQIMALSANPVVLGNMPEEGDEANWVAVGFMGQVPVTVRGEVRAGDYILPSGDNDGTAIAVAPEALTVDHLDRVLGRAWSDSKHPVISVINVAIGLNASDAARVLRQHDLRVAELVEANDAMRGALEAMEARLAAIEASR